MAFGLKKIFGGIKKIVNRVGGGLIGGLIGGAPGAAIGGALFPGAAPAPVQTAGVSAGVPVPRAFTPFGAGAALGGTLGGISAIPRMLPFMGISRIENGEICRTATPLQLILFQAREATGRRVTAKQIIEAARVCGLEVAAQTFGLDVTQVCTVVVTRRRRRARGISAADLRRTRATIRKVAGIQHDLKTLSPPRRIARRK